MKFFSAIFLNLLCAQILFAQQVNNTVNSGNNAYKKGDYKTAEQNFEDALKTDPKNIPARFNLGNALQKQNNAADAQKQYDEIILHSADSSLRSMAYYNKALSLVLQNKLMDAIEAFKKSLILSPSDNDARENLQKALNELRKQQQQQNPQQQKQNPQSNQNNKLNKQQAEQYMQQLRDQEKRLQKELQKKSSGNQPDEDW